MQRYGGLRAAPACSFWFCRCSGRGGRSHLPGAVLLGFDGNPSRRGQRTRVRRANRRTTDMPRWRQQGPIMRLVCTLGLMGTGVCVRTSSRSSGFQRVIGHGRKSAGRRLRLARRPPASAHSRPAVQSALDRAASAGHSYARSSGSPLESEASATSASSVRTGWPARS